MSQIRRYMGVCPQVVLYASLNIALVTGHVCIVNVTFKIVRTMQFDILWESLTGLEHLYLFASIKGLHPSHIKRVRHLYVVSFLPPHVLICCLTDSNRSYCGLFKKHSLELMERVKLTEALHMRAGNYSGGMKRRLSVAIALIGDPKIVCLDEPVNCPLKPLDCLS